MVVLAVLITVFTVAGLIVFIAIVASGKREDEMRAYLIKGSEYNEDRSLHRTGN